MEQEPINSKLIIIGSSSIQMERVIEMMNQNPDVVNLTYTIVDISTLDSIDQINIENIEVIALDTSNKLDFTRKLINSCPNLKWIHFCWSGLNQFKSLSIPEKIVCTNAKGVAGPGLSEFVVFAMLWFAKKGAHVIQNQKEKIYEKFVVDSISGKTLGIFGYGKIGEQCARMTKFGHLMKVLALKRTPEKITELAKGYVDEVLDSKIPENITRVLRESDYILNILPLTEQTKGFFDLSKFQLMKDTAIFMNIGRGNTVVEPDLIESLNTKQIAGAYLDVFAQEPLPKDSPLWELDNILMTPHSATRIKEHYGNKFGRLSSNVSLFMKNLPVEGQVDFASGY